MPIWHVRTLGLGTVLLWFYFPPFFSYLFIYCFKKNVGHTESRALCKASALPHSQPRDSIFQATNSQVPSSAETSSVSKENHSMNLADPTASENSTNPPVSWEYWQVEGWKEDRRRHTGCCNTQKFIIIFFYFFFSFRGKIK